MVDSATLAANRVRAASEQSDTELALLLFARLQRIAFERKSASREAADLGKVSGTTVLG